MSRSESSDDNGDPCGIYSFSADVSESGESCAGSFGLDGDDVGIAGNDVGSSSQASSSHPSWCFPRFGADNSGPLSIDGTSVAVFSVDVDGDEVLKGKDAANPAEIELMKERFAKLLLGEDMSGGGMGVCTALAISNAITNLSATVFGELWRLEPLSSQKKTLWKKEMQWLLCVSDSIVERIPSLQEFPCGKTVEVVITRPRPDLHINLPALKKLDAMLLGILDSFQEIEFWYVERGIIGDDVKMSYHQRQEDKWWLPCPQVPPSGMSADARKKLQHSKDCLTQIFKASLSINNSVLAEMEIPDIYFDSLQKEDKGEYREGILRRIKSRIMDLHDISFMKLDRQTNIEAHNLAQYALNMLEIERIGSVSEEGYQEQWDGDNRSDGETQVTRVDHQINGMGRFKEIERTGIGFEERGNFHQEKWDGGNSGRGKMHAREVEHQGDNAYQGITRERNLQREEDERAKEDNNTKEASREKLKEAYKSGKACLGDIIYRYISADPFSPDCFFDFLEMSSDHQALDVANKIEAAIHVWRRKCYKSHSHSDKGPKNQWSAKVKGLVGDADKTHHLMNRAEILFRTLKTRFPDLSQTTLDMHKIQYNKDVGKSILESYSRVLEFLAFNIIARIDDLIFVDDACKSRAADSAPLLRRGGRGPIPIQKRISPSPFSLQNTPYASPFSTPRFCLSPINDSSVRSAESPLRKFQLHNKYLRKEKVEMLWNMKVERSVITADGERAWACPGNLLGVGKDMGMAPERD